MGPIPPGPRWWAPALVATLVAFALACEGDHTPNVSPLPEPPPNLSGVWCTWVNVHDYNNTCGNLDVDTVVGHTLTVRQMDRSLMVQVNATCHGPLLSCGTGVFGDDIVTLSLSGNVDIDPACTLGVTEQITARVSRQVEWDAMTAASAGPDPALRIDGGLSLDIVPAGNCPMASACSISGEFTAVPSGGSGECCPPGEPCIHLVGCNPPWECGIPL